MGMKEGMGEERNESGKREIERVYGVSLLGKGVEKMNLVK